MNQGPAFVLPGDTRGRIAYAAGVRTLMESIIDGLRDLPERDQVKIMSHIHRLNPRLQREQAEMLRSLHGVLSEEDGLAFEQAIEVSHRVEKNGC